MHRRYFPRCPIEGPITPAVPFAHLGIAGAIPQKCSGCRHQFEGECTRYGDKVGHYLHLDHGPCGVEGPTDPVIYEDTWLRAHVEIPRKCASCRFLAVDRIRGFFCRKDAAMWGAFPRGLDWGMWEPSCTWIQLDPPKKTTRPLLQFAHLGDVIAFVKEYRVVNPDVPMAEAKSDFALIRKKLGRDGG